MREQGIRTRYDYSIYYRAWHDESDAHAASMGEFYRGLLQRYLPDPQGRALLDIGCGMGFALRAMRQYGFDRVLGVDVSPEQIAACKRLGEPGELVDDTRVFLSACRLKFDVVLLLDVLEHVPKVEQIELLAAVYDVLSPGGRILLTVPNATSPLAARWFHNDYTHHSSFTEHSLRFVLANAGFSQIEIPGQGPLRHPPVRFWRRSFWRGFSRWLVHFCWRQVLIAELGLPSVDFICTELNLFCVAYK